MIYHELSHDEIISSHLGVTESFSCAAWDKGPAAAASMSVGIINRSGHPIYIAFRQGPVMKVEPLCLGEITGDIEIIEDLRGNNSFLGTTNDLGVTSDNLEFKTPMLQEIRKKYNGYSEAGDDASKLKQIQSLHMDFFRLRTRYKVNSIFPAGKKTAYLEAHDVYLIKTDKPHEIVAHPFVNDGTSRQMRNYLSSSACENFTGLIYSLYVDKPSLDEKFYFLDGCVVRLKPKCDPSRRPGLYIYASVEDEGVGKEPVGYCPPDNLAEKGVFSTENEARTYGEDPSKYQISVKQHEREILEAKRAWELDKLEWEKERAEADRRLQKLKDKLDAKSAERKDRSEDRKERGDDRREKGEVRKEENEAYKQLPFIIGAIGAVVMAAKAFL